MPNPYHDAEGKFCSKGEMRAAYEALIEAKDYDGYFKLRTEYEAISKEMSPFEMPGAKETITENTRKLPRKTPLTPLELTHPSPLHEPSDTIDEYSGTGIEFVYSWRGAPEGEAEMDYNRNAVYHGARLEGTPNVTTILAQAFRTDESNISLELYEHAVNDLGMESLDAYEYETGMGYYGEEHEVKLGYTASEGLKAWYQKEPGLADSAGIRDYVRSKGVNPDGLSAVDSIKAQLSAEYKGKLPKAVKDAQKVSILKTTPAKIVIPQPNRLTRTQVPEIVVKNSASSEISGIVVKDDKGEYVLVDGYARYKKDTEKPAAGSAKKGGMEERTYIMLEAGRGYWGDKGVL